MQNVIHYKPAIKASRLMSDGSHEPISIIAQYTDTDGVVFTYKSRTIGGGAVHRKHVLLKGIPNV